MTAEGSGGELKGRRALVTGGARGIGAAVARRLVERGAAVVVADIDGAAAADLAGAIHGRSATVDVSDTAAVRAAVEGFGPFDILVNNAGVDQHAFFTETDERDWHRLLGINLLGVFATVHACLPAMQAAEYGRIVNVASEAGRLGSRGGSVYAAAKGGVIAFTKSIARENARYGITANCVAPGPIDTPLVRAGIETGGEKLLKAMTDATLLRRLGRPEEVAAAVLYLTSDEAAFVTGETIGVSGGMGIGAG